MTLLGGHVLSREELKRRHGVTEFFDEFVAQVAAPVVFGIAVHGDELAEYLLKLAGLFDELRRCRPRGWNRWRSRPGCRGCDYGTDASIVIPRPLVERTGEGWVSGNRRRDSSSERLFSCDTEFVSVLELSARRLCCVSEILTLRFFEQRVGGDATVDLHDQLFQTVLELISFHHFLLNREGGSLRFLPSRAACVDDGAAPSETLKRSIDATLGSFARESGLARYGRCAVCAASNGSGDREVIHGVLLLFGDLHFVRCAHRFLLELAASSSMARMTALTVGSMPVSLFASRWRSRIFSYSSESTRTEIAWVGSSMAPKLSEIFVVDNVHGVP